DETAFVEFANKAGFDQIVNFDATHFGIQIAHHALNVAQAVRRWIRFFLQADKEILVTFLQYHGIVQLHLPRHGLNDNIAIARNGNERLRFEQSSEHAFDDLRSLTEISAIDHQTGVDERNFCAVQLDHDGQTLLFQAPAEKWIEQGY